jgi:hypothetical protein
MTTYFKLGNKSEYIRLNHFVQAKVLDMEEYFEERYSTGSKPMQKEYAYNTMKIICRYLTVHSLLTESYDMGKLRA